MPAASTVLTVLVVVVVAVGLLLTLLAARVRGLGRRVGSFECARRADGEDWTSGIAVFGVGRIDWFRTVSLRLRPTLRLRREELEILGRSRRGGAVGHVVEVRCRYRSEDFDLAMVDTAYSGLVSWTESAPPRGEYAA